MLNRFSPEAFETSTDRKSLIADLQREVERLLAPKIAEAMEEVVAQLNAAGHKLVMEPSEEASGVCFETAEDAPGRYLYLCHDSTVSAGWRTPEYVRRARQLSA